MIRKYTEIFCWKNVSSFCSAKATHIFSVKNIRILYIESTKTVNEMTLNELVKLTTLWTTGPWTISLNFSLIQLCFYDYFLLGFYSSLVLFLMYSWLSLSRPRLSRITAYLEVKIWSLPIHENLTTDGKYCRKEEKLLLRSNFSSFPQYFQYISNFKSPITYQFVKCG